MDKERTNQERNSSNIKRAESRKQSYRCVWSNDNNKYACQIYRKHYGNKELVEADIKTINPNTIPDHTLLTAGFPCQAFSIAGKRKGFEDTRGTLFYDIARVAEAKRPKILLLENVKGLLSAQNGYCFYRILETLDELGYLVEWQVLNSKHFGVPQNRERVFIIGHLRGTSSKQIFPIGETGGIPPGKGEGKPESREEASTLEASYGKSKSMNNMVVALQKIGNIAKSGHDSLWGRVYDPKGVSSNLNARGGGVGAKTGLYLTESRIRRLTPVECERLQGFPDGWTAEGIDGTGKAVKISDTQRYKVLGNAVTTNVIEFLGKQLLSSFLGCAL